MLSKHDAVLSNKRVKQLVIDIVKSHKNKRRAELFVAGKSFGQLKQSMIYSSRGQSGNYFFVERDQTLLN